MHDTFVEEAGEGEGGVEETTGGYTSTTTSTAQARNSSIS